ncbi:hypothetical protein LCGC14_1492790 [marine sediment metagenome]|uniref:Uncharacterized protein n=1 Tax=marine sediment metagenome TaxID=412755 RepID=A0A0F9JS83_9ZZZZ
MRVFTANDKDLPRATTLPMRRNWLLRADELLVSGRGGRTRDVVMVLADNGRVTVRRVI